MKDTNWHRSPMAPSRVRMEARRVGGCAWSMARDEAERNKTACGSEEQEPCPFPVSPGESRAGRVPPTPPNPGGSPRKRASPLARSPANDHRFFHCHKFLLDRNRPSHGSLERKRWAWSIFSHSLPARLPSLAPIARRCFRARKASDSDVAAGTASALLPGIELANLEQTKKIYGQTSITRVVV